MDERELVGVDSAELEAATDELRDRFSGLGELLPSLSFRFLHREGTAPGERKPILAGNDTALLLEPPDLFSPDFRCSPLLSVQLPISIKRQQLPPLANLANKFKLENVSVPPGQFPRDLGYLGIYYIISRPAGYEAWRKASGCVGE